MSNSINYINVKHGRDVETIEEFKNHISYTEKRKLLQEYSISDPSGNYYFSTRCTKDWNNK